MNKKIIIDCDPGIDDAFALLYAFKEPSIDIELITTVSGNVSVDKTTANAIGMVNMAKQDIRVVRGARRPLVDNPRFADNIHGVSGLGTYTFEGIDLQSHEHDDVVRELYEAIMNSEEKITLVPIGPFTNIARLLLLHPEVKDKIEAISIMGGGIKGGNYNMAAEFNVVVDPEAAAVMFNSGIPIIMAGLDVTEKALLYPAQLEEIAKIPTIGAFLEEIVKSNPRPQRGDSLLQLNDVLAIMVLTHPEIFTIEDLYVDVELYGSVSRGWTLADQRRYDRHPINTKVITDLDYTKFSELLMERLHRYE